jgi:hypothetical protein
VVITGLAPIRQCRLPLFDERLEVRRASRHSQTSWAAQRAIRGQFAIFRRLTAPDRGARTSATSRMNGWSRS